MKVRIAHGLNVLWLVAVLTALPWMVSRTLGDWQIASRSTWQSLVFVACGIAAGINGLSWLLARRRPLRRVCLGWAFFFLGVAVFEVLLFRGVVHFRWLQ